MSKKLFVGGLSWGTTDDRLREAFTRFGEVVEAKIITDRETGRSRGFGFVTFADPTHGDAAMSAMDNQDLDGRTIRVNEAQNQQPRRSGPPGGGPPRAGGPPPMMDAGERGRGGGDRERDKDRDGGRDDGGRRGKGERDGGRRQRY
jgi:RNA recognition motif-containing protein